MKICEICGQRPARYICRECGSSVCENCFIPERWICINCYRKLPHETVALTRETWFSLPFKLFLIGFIIVFIGTLILMLASLSGAFHQGGGFVWIFPLPPIIFGTNHLSLPLMLMLVIPIIILITLVCFYFYHLNK